MRRLKLITAMIVALCFAAPTPASAIGWEQVKTEKVAGQHVASDAEVEIRTAGGTIFVNVNRPTHIKIFTILGSQIADDTLQPGSYQFAVPTHGVFIIKTGQLTCKVAV